MIGDSLRTDPQAYRRVRLDDPLMIQLREWSRVDEDLGIELTRLTNQLRDLVYRMAPGLLALCPAADEPWFWAPVAQAPDAGRPATAVGAPTRTGCCASIAYVGSRRQRCGRSCNNRRVYTAPGVIDAVAAHCQVLLPRVELVARQRREAGRTLERLLDGA